MPLVKKNTNIILRSIAEIIHTKSEADIQLITEKFPNYNNLRVIVDPPDGTHRIIILDKIYINCLSNGNVVLFGIFCFYFEFRI